MKHFAQFFQMSTGYIAGTIPPKFGEPKVIEASGDRSVLQIDARLTRSNMGQIAQSECIKRGYVAWQIVGGNSLRDAKPLHSRNFVHVGKVDNTAQSANFGA